MPHKRVIIKKRKKGSIVMTKSVKTKLVAILMAVVCLFSAFVVMASAADVFEVEAKNGVYVFTAPSGAAEHFAIARKGVQFEVAKYAGDWGYVKGLATTTGAKTGWVYLPYCKELVLPGEFEDGYYTVTAAKAYVYKYATAYGQKIATLKKGDIVAVDAIGGDWGYVSFTNNGKTVKGYVYLRQFKAFKEYKFAQPGLYVAMKAVNIYRANSANSLKYGTLKKGTQFTVTAVAGDWGRIKVKYHGQIIPAYVYMPYCAEVIG
jgi:uncharacterized protein YgiM (DUF1202 family)